MFHPLLTAFAIYTASITIATDTLQPPSRHLLQVVPALPSIEISADLSGGWNNIFNTDEFADFFIVLYANTVGVLPADVFAFYVLTSNINLGMVFAQLFGQGFEAIIESECQRDEIDEEELAQDINELLIAAARNEECTNIALFDFVSPLSNQSTEALDAFYNAVFEGIDEELSEDELATVREELSIAEQVILAEGAEVVIEADCDLSADINGKDVGEDIGELFEDFLELLFDEDDDDDDEDDDDDDDMDAAARNDGRAREDVYIGQFVGNEGLEGVDGGDKNTDNGTEVITLHIAQSTIVNIWSVLAVFCCFNAMMVSIFVCRRNKKAMVYVSDDERGGSLTDGQRV